MLMATPVFDEYLGPLQARDEKSRKSLVRNLISSTILLWFGFAAALATGVALIAAFSSREISNNPYMIAGIVCVCISVPFIVAGVIMISVTLLVKEAIDETHQPRLFRSEELRNVFYPRQYRPPSMEGYALNRSKMNMIEEQEEHPDEPPPEYVPPVALPKYPGPPNSRDPPRYDQPLPVITLVHASSEEDVGEPTGPRTIILN